MEKSLEERDPVRKKGPGELLQGLLPPGSTIMYSNEKKVKPRAQETFVDR